MTIKGPTSESGIEPNPLFFFVAACISLALRSGFYIISYRDVSVCEGISESTTEERFVKQQFDGQCSNRSDISPFGDRSRHSGNRMEAMHVCDMRR